MEVRFPTYSPREIQRAAQRPGDDDDVFVQVLGHLNTDTERDMSGRSRQAETAAEEGRGRASRRAAERAHPLGAEAIAAAIDPAAVAGITPSALRPVVGQTLDVLA